MYSALRAANAPGQPAWSPYAVIDKQQYDHRKTTTPSKKYKEVIFIGSQNSKLKQLMDAQGVIFAKKANTPSLLLYIVAVAKSWMLLPKMRCKSKSPKVRMYGYGDSHRKR